MKITDLTSNSYTSFRYDGISVKNKNTPQLCVKFPI